MTHTDKRQQHQIMRKILSHVYSFVDTVIAFFAVWTFFSMLRVVVGLNTEVYWLSKALIQQVLFICAALIMCVAIILGQHLFERSMNKNDTWVPKSFIVMSAIIFAVYLVCKIIVIVY